MNLITTPQLDRLLDRARTQQELTPDEGITLLQQTDPQAIAAIRQVADHLRMIQVGDTVTYVINRNINFTNICEQHCSFCAFRRDPNQSGAYWLELEQIIQKTQQAVNLGATEICIQGGLNPQAQIDGKIISYYIQIVKSIKQEFPHLHIHAFSPQEIQFIARTDHLSYHQIIATLKEAGLGSMPGTAAEILDDQIRQKICPEKINTQTWLSIISTAHQLEINTTSTMLSGHIETPTQQIQHLSKLKTLQQQSHKKGYKAQITEFILLPFVGQNAPKQLKNQVNRDQPDLEKSLLLTAIARIYLGNWIKNHQPSWVKLGLSGATKALTYGCNDIGGTLMEEHITSMAGAKGGTSMTPENLQEAIQSLNRPYQQRDTLYNKIRGRDI